MDTIVGAEIGTIYSVENEKKRWPFVTMSILIIISIMVCMLCFKDGEYIGLLFVLLLWLFFFLFITLRYSKRRILTFGTKGCTYHYRNGKRVRNTVLFYKDVLEPCFNIVDYKINGVHNSYWFTVSYGVFSFNYIYDDNDIPDGDFDYICAHKLYRYWSKYISGKESDFKESEKVLLRRLHNMMDGDLGR